MKIEEAIRVASTAHEGQLDKTGYPAIFHPLRVMLAVSHPDEQVVAVLHDTIEDTKLDLEFMKRLGLPEKITDALDAMTRRDDESYFDYVERCKKNPIAKNVKYADVADNMSPHRSNGLEPKKQKSMRKRYLKTIKVLE
jgi:(p)ppGpp synthase/HD superfamily hydrolase